LDNVLDVTSYPLDKLKEISMEERRIGLGFTAYADMLIKLGLRYGASDALAFTQILALVMRDEAYKSSIELSKERGSFNTFLGTSFIESGFCRRLPDEIRNDILKYGIRNISCLTVAPTGTQSLSLGNNCSSGIEPVFAFKFDRTIRQDYATDNVKKETVYDEVYLDYLTFLNISNKDDISDLKLPDYFVSTYDITPKEKIDTISLWQKCIDNSIANTLNLPPGTTFEQYKDLYMYAHDAGCKGFTTFNVDGSMKGILEAPIKKDKTVIRHEAPARPQELECDIHEIKVKEENFFVLVGLFNEEPYEVFVDNNTVLKLDILDKGLVRKIGKGSYDLVIQHDGEEKYIIKNIGKNFDKTYGILTRLISTALRHGTPIEFLIEQLQKSDTFTSFERALARVLKEYVKDGSKTESKESCPECGSPLEYIEGCLTCSNKCGYSRCS
jgi:ribonucleoside-diphosphate reductase alpha chain